MWVQMSRADRHAHHSVASLGKQAQQEASPSESNPKRKQSQEHADIARRQVPARLRRIVWRLARRMSGARSGRTDQSFSGANTRVRTTQKFASTGLPPRLSRHTGAFIRSSTTLGEPNGKPRNAAFPNLSSCVGRQSWHAKRRASVHQNGNPFGRRRAA